MEDMLLVLYSFHIGGNCEAFEQSYRECLPRQKQFPGHLSEILVRSEGERSSYTIVSRWTASAFKSWLQSPEHDSVVEMLNRFQRKNSSVKKYIVTCSDEVPIS